MAEWLRAVHAPERLADKEAELGGFLYFFIFVPFMAMAQSLRFTVALLAVIGLLPNLLALGAGFGDHLELRAYNAYVWMVYPPVVGILLLLESLQYSLRSAPCLRARL